MASDRVTLPGWAFRAMATVLLLACTSLLGVLTYLGKQTLESVRQLEVDVALIRGESTWARDAAREAKETAEALARRVERLEEGR